jgi:hypothetical protein
MPPEDVNELKADRIPQRLCDLGKPRGPLPIDIGINDRLAAPVALGPLDLRREL